MGRMIFITGTDTGVGKTILTGLLLAYLRRSGCHALAMKPFCSGGKEDVELLDSIQGGALAARLLNPFYFEPPLTPLRAARQVGKCVELKEVLDVIREAERKCEVLLVEGAGGLLSPLGEQFSLADLIQCLGGPVILVGRNQLGVINHVRLGIRCLQAIGAGSVRVVLMSSETPDQASASNPELLAELLAPLNVVCLPFLGENAENKEALCEWAKKLEKALANLVERATF